MCLVDRRGMNFRSRWSNLNASLNVKLRTGGRRDRVIPLSMSVTGASNLEPKRTKQKHEKSVSHDNVIDKWMKDSVVEIVKNLHEVPLLVHVYSDKGKGDSPRLETEKAVPDCWPMIKSKWEKRTTPLPDGVIFVGRLKHDEVEESDALIDFGRESEITRAWGIVVQAKGANCGPACYLLKTSRAEPGSVAGLGLYCTHFCLVKVKSFRQTVEDHFKNCWLLNSD